MSWADLFERARDHETTIETISNTLGAVRAGREHGGDGDA